MSDYPDCVGRELARLREVGNAPTWSPIIDPELAKQFSEVLKDEVDDTDDVDEDAFWNELDTTWILAKMIPTKHKTAQRELCRFV